MKIVFYGNEPKQKYYRLGVMKNNKVDNLEFQVPRIHSECKDHIIDLSIYKVYLKIGNQDLTFLNKEPINDVIFEKEVIKIFYQITRKVTRNKSVDMQLQFERDINNDIEIWQTQSFNVTFDNCLDIEGYIAEEKPEILQDHEKRINNLEQKMYILEYPTRSAFPTLGMECVIYVDSNENKSYRFDMDDLKYYVIGSNYEDIKIIDGNW